jgi:hypothetical protein
MALHEAGLKADRDLQLDADALPLLVLPPEPFPTLHTDDFVETQQLSATAPAPLETDCVPDLVVGAWLSLQGDCCQWQRIQLTWSSPHGTLYLFNGPGRRSTSMTRRSFEKLLRSQRLTLVAGHSVVDDALDSVVDVTVLNSARAPAAPGEPTEYPDLLPPLG